MSVETARPAGSPEASGRSPAMASGCLVLFALPFVGVGVVSAVLLVAKLYESDWRAAGLLAIFALAFGGAGAGVITAALMGRREATRRALATQAHPAEPWLWRADWASGSIEETGRKGQYFLWAFAGLWNLIAWPTAVLVIRAALEQGNRLALIGLLFPVVGLGLLIAAVRATIRERKFGVSVLELGTTPGVVGHGFAGTVRTPSDALPTGGLVATLSCVNVRTTGSGKNRSTTETVRWQDQETVAGQRTASSPGRGIETTIPVRFRIPPDVAPTDDTNPSDRTVWRLQVTAAVPGVDYAAAFEVPVFRTEKSLEPVTGDEETLLGPVPESLPYRQPRESPIRVSTGPRGTQIGFPAARNPGAALGLSAFAALWGGVVWLLVAVKAGPFFIGIFGLVELALIYGVLRMWLWVVEVTAGRDGVAIASGFVAVGEPARIPAADVAGVEVLIGMQSGSTVYYSLQVVRKDGRKVTAGSGIRDKREAEWLAGLVKQAVGA
jgi:hypothetical protein